MNHVPTGTTAFKVNELLFPCDFSDFAARAIPYIVSFLRHFPCRLHLVHWPEHKQTTQAVFKQEAATVIDQIRQQLGRPFEWKQQLVEGVAAGPAIVDYSLKAKIDLIILASHGRRGIPRFFLGSVAQEVAHLSPCHVLTVKSANSVTEPLIRKILVPLDFSDASRRGLQYAKDLATVWSAQIDLVHVLSDKLDSILWLAGRKQLLELVPDWKDRAEKQLRHEALSMELTDAGIHICLGHLSTAIVKLACQQNADLIIMPDQGLTGSIAGQKQHHLGMVTQAVLHACQGAILILRKQQLLINQPDKQGASPHSGNAQG